MAFEDLAAKRHKPAMTGGALALNVSVTLPSIEISKTPNSVSPIESSKENWKQMRAEFDRLRQMYPKAVIVSYFQAEEKWLARNFSGDKSL